MTATNGMLIVGAGIAGLAAALRLHQAGWQPVVIERAPTRRRCARCWASAVSLMRGDVEDVLYQAVREHAELRFGTAFFGYRTNRPMKELTTGCGGDGCRRWNWSSDGASVRRPW